MTWKDRLLIIFAVLILLEAGACVGIYFFYHNPQIIFEWKGKTTETVYVPMPAGGYEQCYKSPIEIDGKQTGDKFLVTARDECKYASRLLGVKTVIYHHMPLITYSAVYNIEANQFRHGVSGMYFYNFGPVAIGGGLTAVFDKQKIYDAGPTIGLAAFFR